MKCLVLLALGFVTLVNANPDQYKRYSGYEGYDGFERNQGGMEYFLLKEILPGLTIKTLSEQYGFSPQDIYRFHNMGIRPIFPLEHGHCTCPPQLIIKSGFTGQNYGGFQSSYGNDYFRGNGPQIGLGVRGNFGPEEDSAKKASEGALPGGALDPVKEEH